MSSPKCEEVSWKEQGESAFLCGEGDDWYLDVGELDGGQQKRGKQRKAQSQINGYLFRDCQCSGTLTEKSSGAGLPKAFIFISILYPDLREWVLVI